jgi:Rrf2 family protein
MKLSSQEEYGLRCLLQVARSGESLTIAELSRLEGISSPNVAKILRVLRRGGFLKATRGQAGGYTLARPADQIAVGDVLAATRTPAWPRCARTCATALSGRCCARSKAPSTTCSASSRSRA